MHKSSLSSRPPLATLTAVALISATVLGFEIALTRIFSVLLRYHFGFLSISIALCGLGLGGYAMNWMRRRKAPSLGALALLFGLSIDITLVLILRVVFAYFPEAFWVAALLLLVPFSVAGAFLSEVFMLYPQWSGRLYAWDLAGAALAAVGVIGLLQLSSAINACLAIAMLAAVGAIWVPWADPESGDAAQSDETRQDEARGDVAQADAPPSDGAGSSQWAGGLSFAVVFVLLMVLITNKQFDWLDIPPIPPKVDAENQSLADKNVTQPLFTELGTPGHTSRIIDTRWNAFARTDVVEDKADPGSLLIYTNGNVPTNMMKWNGDLSIVTHLGGDFALSDWAFAIAPLGGNAAKGGQANFNENLPHGRVLSIGPGGGLDALLSLYHGAAEFNGAEINPSIVGIMRDYRKYNGGIYERPDVHVITAEGRAFVREAAAHGQHYAVIFSALTKTATAGQGMALLESFIHTEDAFRDYLRALDDNGQLTLVVDNPMLLNRFFATAVAVLKAQGMDEKAACRHLSLIYDPRPYGPYRFGVVLQKSPFTRTQTFMMMDKALKRGLTPILIPDQAARDDVGSITTGSFPIGPIAEISNGQMTLEQFVQAFAEPADWRPALDISPCPDNRPFVLDLSPTVLPIFKQLAAVAALLAIVLAVVSWRDTIPTNFSRNDSATHTKPVKASRFALPDMLYLLYFLALGIGFMLVEIPLSQKLILPLGYPTLALTVILFSILLGGGLGSWASQRFNETKLRLWTAGCAVGVALGTLLSIYILGQLQNAMLTMSLPSRCMVAALLLLPLGFLLGTPFPAGLRLFARTRAHQVPLIWGLNGVSSVVGSLCAAMGAKAWGFNNVLLLGALTYLGAAVLLTIASGGKIADEDILETTAELATEEIVPSQAL
ncbi:MAG: hypothetical protein JO316_05475 [Abitibacteriaceae bacterium]|nr:hypothetical protein [Abditibacteriaceae bacterium]